MGARKGSGMMTKKQYGSAEQYEKKLERVMERLGVDDYTFNWDRWHGWVQFRYRGELYQFEHSVEKAQSRGIELKYGSDAFAQVVLSLEDLARMVERGIYELSTWVAGMKMLPPAREVPEYFRLLGFDQIPDSASEAKTRYKMLAKQIHPDSGGSEVQFKAIKNAVEQAIGYFEEGKLSET